MEVPISVAAAAIGGLLGYRARVSALLVIGALALAVAVWAFATSTDARHPDYAWAVAGGDPKLIFGSGIAFYFLPVFAAAALIGLFAHYVWAGSQEADRQDGNEEP